MKDADFKGILAGLEDALAYTKGETARARVIPGIDVKMVRGKTQKTQVQFSQAFHIPVATLRDWEQGRRAPDAPARTLLSLIERDPVTVEKMLAAE